MHVTQPFSTIFFYSPFLFRILLGSLGCFLSRICLLLLLFRLSFSLCFLPLSSSPQQHKAKDEEDPLLLLWGSFFFLGRSECAWGLSQLAFARFVGHSPFPSRPCSGKGGGKLPLPPTLECCSALPAPSPLLEEWILFLSPSPQAPDRNSQARRGKRVLVVVVLYLTVEIWRSCGGAEFSFRDKPQRKGEPRRNAGWRRKGRKQPRRAY